MPVIIVIPIIMAVTPSQDHRFKDILILRSFAVFGDDAMGDGMSICDGYLAMASDDVNGYWVVLVEDQARMRWPPTPIQIIASLIGRRLFDDWLFIVSNELFSAEK